VEGLGTEEVNKDPVTFLALSCFHFSVLYSKDSKKSKESKELLYCFQLVYGSRIYENISIARSRSAFIIQNYYMRKLETIFRAWIKIWGGKN
jgi:hypothetical protein